MKLLVATLFLSGVLSAPAVNEMNNYVEKPTCIFAATRFHTTKSMLFSYEGETITGIVGASEDHTGLKLHAKCRISPVLPCKYTLQISEVELLEGQGKNQDALDFKLSPGSEGLSRELTAHDLNFETNNGLIMSIQPQVEEPVHVLNIKRGILSSLQLKLVDRDHSLTEVDVNGECSAKYQVKARHDSSLVKTILKTKDLSLCKDRSETNLGIPVTHYPTEKPFSLLKSNSLCKFMMSEKQRIESVSCEETHLFRPFSARYNSSSGAMTTVRQKLTLIGHKPRNIEGYRMPATEKLSLKYEHKKNPESTTKKTKEVEDILEKLCAEEGVKPDAARLFTKLIFAVRRLNMKGMEIVWYKHYECLKRESCTKEQSEKKQEFIVDALSRCGTVDCAEFMIKTMMTKKVSTPQSVAFLTGIALVGKPSENMVGNILNFCEGIPSRPAFLTLGTLMHKFCSQHSCDNLQPLSPIYKAETFLRQKLMQNCQTSTPEEREAVTLVLKAIGNAGRPITSVENILKCAVQPGPTAINVDALQALRRMPCGEMMTQGLLNIFDDPSMDTEIRIETYLALMRCPTMHVVQKIADILDAEKNTSQVGSFVWWHLTNALESSEPVYGVKLRKAILEGLDGRKLRPFKYEHLRFHSHAYEGSYYNKKHEFGGSSQAQVIFHPDSYFPRSAKLNFTADVLGASVNLLETSARFEGFETLIEDMFGPGGYFPDERLMDLLNTKPTGGRLREERSVFGNEMDEIKANLKTLQDKMHIERKKPTGGLSLKLFGHELKFLEFDYDWLQRKADAINWIENLIKLARGGEVTYTNSFMLLEADHEIPTALGFPLKLAVNGSGVSSVTLKGKLDIRNMFWGKKMFDIHGSVTPSANIGISGKMSVDATHASSGIHVNASLFTSTEIIGDAGYKEGEGFKLSIEPPTKPLYVVSVKSNLVTFLNKRRQPITASPRQFEHKNCVNLTKSLGVNLCGHVSFPRAYLDYNAPYFPLAGDTAFELVLHATNPKLAGFELQGRRPTSEDENRYDWIWNVHIPGLMFGRKIVGISTFQYLEDGKYLSVTCRGVDKYRFGKFEAKYSNVSRRLYTKLSTPTMSYLKPITVETETFTTTNSDTGAREIGISINASYNNYMYFTIQNVLSVYMHKDQYELNNTFTYSPKKYIMTETRFSLEKKNIYIKVNDTGNNCSFFFSGELGKKISRFYAKIGHDHDHVKYGMNMNGELNMMTKKVLIKLTSKPFGHLVTFEALPRRNDLEIGYHMRLSLANLSSNVTGDFVSSYPKTELTLKFDGFFMKQPFLFRSSYYVRSSGGLFEWVAQGFGDSANASLEYEYSLEKWSRNYLELCGAAGAFMNNKRIKIRVFSKQSGLRAYFEMNGQTENRKMVEADFEYVRLSDEETALRCDITGLAHATTLVWSYYNNSTESGLKMVALYKEFEAKWSIILGGRCGVRFVAMYMKNELRPSQWKKNGKELILYEHISLKNTFGSEGKQVCLEITGLFQNRFKTCLKFKYNDLLKSLRVRIVSEARGKTAEMGAVWIHKVAKSGEEIFQTILCSGITDRSADEMETCLISDESKHLYNASPAGRETPTVTTGVWIYNAKSKGIVLQTVSNGVKTSDFFFGFVTPSAYRGLRMRFTGIVKRKSVVDLLKDIITHLQPNKTKEYIEKYMDVEYLRNKTKAIEKDFNLMLDTANICSIESLVRPLMVSGEFSVHVMKPVWKHTDVIVWEIVAGLSNLNSWIPSSNSFLAAHELSKYAIKCIWNYTEVWTFVEGMTNTFHSWIRVSKRTAMIFGKPHVYTFDGKTYKFVGYKKPSCTYVLAHDFRHHDFTILSQEKALIIDTRSGFIKIHENGEVEATVSKDAEGNEVKTTYSELPVEMMQMAVRREGSFIKIKHPGLDIVCDVRHFLCTFSIDKFYHGKVAGLLGTNNDEQYDEFLKPDRTIDESVVEFANAWEVSGDPECKVNHVAEHKPTCDKTPSPRCHDLFMGDSSPLARYFKTLDPKPFYDACLFDTSDCKADVPPNQSFCNVTAAYTALLREKGVWVRQLPECVSCGSISSWTERGNKNVDVVLLIPETLKLESYMLNLRGLLRELEKDLHMHKYTTRFAVVGFGGKSTVHRRPHIVTGGGKIFCGMEDVQRAIKHMQFTAEEANAFQAIEYLGHLPFHPGATKVAIMITDQNCEAMAKAPLEKAMKELDMHGVIFNVIGPYFEKHGHRNVLGMWKGQAMVIKDESQRKLADIGLPVNDYIRLAEFSEGGVFNLNAYSKEHDDWTSLLKKKMKATIVKQVDEVQRFCRHCVCVARLMAEPVTFCRINKHARCL